MSLSQNFYGRDILMHQSSLTTTHTVEVPAVDAAKKLARVIGESRVFQNYERAMQQLREDSDAKRLFSDYQEAQRNYQMANQWGGTTAVGAQQLQKMKQQVFAHPILKAYFQAQEALAQTLQEINVFISEKLGIDFANTTKPSGGCC
jgi:cell fate (sporulation/competence/biofilm development) regulator YlbF (YheA/YmcA/DUF963 family)